MGTFGDFQWTYPTNFSSPNAYAQHRFTKHELQPCQNNTNVLCCTIGSSAVGLGQVGNGCGFRMDFMAEFEPIPHRQLFSLVDALLAWRKANPSRLIKQMEMLFIGDSVTGQVFTAALCELARNNLVQSLTYNSMVTVPVQFQTLQTALSFQESHVRLRGMEDFDFTLIFIRQFFLTHNPVGISTFFSKADVVLFGWGLHYDRFHDLLRETLSKLLTHLSKVNKQRTYMWIGPSRRHFRYELDNNQVEGEFYHGPSKLRFCGQVARFPSNHIQFQVLNKLVYQHVSTTKHFPARWWNWNNPPTINTTTNMVHFFPFNELTSPFYRNYVRYNANATVWTSDCTHTCWAPNLFEPMWDALYWIMASGQSPPQQRYPAGTQQYPTIVNYSGQLRYVEMIGQLINQTL
ncbi:hypothetical protein BASA81_000655 [Batrachochytrium salamandrivorans]|nr:hypothetical protein BASA81_000655 [Batrachochytrium salamandrivorans]